MTKRWFDLVAALLGLLFTAPLMLVAAVAIAVTMGRPVLFRQERIGRGDRPFVVAKFRTMRAGTGDDADRLTVVGRWLRATSIDELPQLWNVVRGEMSLVGPRPLLPQYVDRYSARQRLRHDVRPGITGLAQISGRNGIDWETRLELDVQYVESCSWRRDLAILGVTVKTVLTADGVTSADHATMTEFAGSNARSTPASTDTAA
ncbi:MAG: sugar transferase [Acidimicrobiales bacterium]|nr:sugar transferase [Acidimicrobiales bacterium]